MKSKLYSTSLKTLVLTVSLSVCVRSSILAQGKDRDSTLAAIKPAIADSHTELRIALPQGYLKVYSATGEVNDGDAWYFPHSSYAIYTIDGKLFKNVDNHISRSDEIPEVVALPVGSYIVEARSDKHGYIRKLVVIKKGHQTVLNLGLGEKATLARFARN